MLRNTEKREKWLLSRASLSAILMNKMCLMEPKVIRLFSDFAASQLSCIADLPLKAGIATSNLPICH